MEANEPDQSAITRRTLIRDGAGAFVATGLAGNMLAPHRALIRRRGLGDPRRSQFEALRTLGRTSLRLPDSLPNPSLAMGTDTLPEIEHIVVLMLENHTYDNFLGMLGRAPGQRPRGDGYTLAADGRPTAGNPAADGSTLRAFRMPTTCQLHGKPSQEWRQSHIQYADGSNDGFVISNSGPVAMGYWDQTQLPFTYALASQFPVGDRWFSSLLGQTDPNRRYLLAATSNGMTDDIGGALGNLGPDASLVLPVGGTICERLNAAGVSWIDYYTSFPAGATVELYPILDAVEALNHTRPITQFFTDAAAGALPAFSLLDPDYGKQSQEDPQNIVLGESFLARTVTALGSSPAWLKTLLIVTYDEGGGYFDHVPPPAALAPDSVAPQVQPGESQYDGFRRYGFRVPSVVVSPFAKRNYVSHVVYDHTSVLALLERKWNLPAMTYRDANANDLLDFVDLNAMAQGRPTFPELPRLPASGENADSLRCSTTGPGGIPPPPPPPSPAPAVKLVGVRVDRRHRAVVVRLTSSHGSLRGLEVELLRGRRRVATRKLATLGAAAHAVSLRPRGGAQPTGRYTLTVSYGGKTILRKTLHVA